jgi:hypothetical protein
MRTPGILFAASFVLVAASWAQEVSVPAPVAPPAMTPDPAVPEEPAPAAPEDEAVADLAAVRAATAEPSPSLRRPDADLPAKTEVTIDRRSAFAAGVRFSGPTGAGVRLSLLRGLGADVRDGMDRVDAVCSVPVPHCAGGFLLDAEAGSGGGRLSLGVGGSAKVISDDFRGTVGAGLKLSVVRTWGSPLGTDPGLTYLGPELDLYVLRAGLGVGVLWRVAGEGGATALFTWGIGVRL